MRVNKPLTATKLLISSAEHGCCISNTTLVCTASNSNCDVCRRQFELRERFCFDCTCDRCCPGVASPASVGPSPREVNYIPDWALSAVGPAPRLPASNEPPFLANQTHIRPDGTCQDAGQDGAARAWRTIKAIILDTSHCLVDHGSRDVCSGTPEATPASGPRVQGVEKALLTAVDKGRLLLLVQNAAREAWLVLETGFHEVSLQTAWQAMHSHDVELHCRIICYLQLNYVTLSQPSSAHSARSRQAHLKCLAACSAWCSMGEESCFVVRS